MRHIIIRIVFVLVLCLLYILGQHANPLVETLFNVRLEINVLLPLFSLAFYDYWLRFFTNLMVKFEIKKIVTEKDITIRNNLTYYGRDPIAVSLREISGIFDVNAKVTYSNEKSETLNFPTNHTIVLNSIQPFATIEIHLFFRRDPKPKMIIFGHKIYILKLLFRVGNSQKRKILFVHRKT